MTIHRTDSEEESLFKSYPYALYFVQSPSTVSHANSAELRHATAADSTTQRLTLSHYSSSRGSTNSFLHEKKICNHHDMMMDQDDHDLVKIGGGGGGRKRVGDYESEEEEEDEEEYLPEDYWERNGGGGWWRYFTFRNSSSWGWITLQICLRVLVSLIVAMLVFCLATKPPPPNLSLKMGRIGEFGLGEGVDGSGVSTKILNCNCTLELLIDNKSKLFGLHVHPPLLSISYANLPFATSQGGELYAWSDDKTSFKLYVGTRNKPMYGAGRSMQDMLETKKGLALVIRVSLRSSFHVVWKLVKSNFHHQVECFLVIGRAYDKKHRTQVYNSRCTQTS